MSDIDREIRNWRTSLEDSQALLLQDVDELESHVRDEIFDLEARGLTKPEALWVALGRAGDPVALATEYGKVNPGVPWARRWYWMTLGFTLFTALWWLLGGLVFLGSAAVYRVWSTADAIAYAVAGLSLLSAALVFASVRASASGSRNRFAEWPRRAMAWVDRHPLLVLSACTVPLLLFGMDSATRVISVYVHTGAVDIVELGRITGRPTHRIANILAIGAVFATPLLLVWSTVRTMQRAQVS